MTRDFVEQACNISWWKGLSGSRPFVWRWPSDCVMTTRDGRHNYVKGGFSVCIQIQNFPGASSFKKIKKKLAKVLSRG